MALDSYSYAPLVILIKPEALYTGTMDINAMPGTHVTTATLVGANAGTDNATGWIEVAGNNVDYERDSVVPNQSADYEDIMSGNRYGLTDSRLSTQQFDITWNMRNEQLSLISHLMHGNAITSVSAGADQDGGFRMAVSIAQATYNVQALLRMSAPTKPDLWLQYWIPKAKFQNQSSSAIGLSTPFTRTVMVKALEHTTLGYGYVFEATAPAT